MRVGFMGLGAMGTPMALNLSRRFPIAVWNRSPSKYPLLRQAGAIVAETPQELAEKTDVVFTMLFDENAYQSILNEDFWKALRGKTLVNSSSVSVEFSHYLAGEARKAGAQFIEMPVSGSKVPAEQGQLIGMLAGDFDTAQQVKSIVEPMTKDAIYCGNIGMGLKTKYAVNVFLITMTAGLAESMALAKAQGLDIAAFGQVLDAGPMASAYSKMKIDKMVRQDYSPQATLEDCYNLTQLIVSASEEANAQTPLIQLCGSLYRRAIAQGHGKDDMIAVEKLLGNTDTSIETEKD
ncbi:NAD(P)-dependent oxidoreductase [Aspergillus clavatus NRRL 1]|uniref:NAD binding NADP oxidoreductase coenzyme F420-dependent, putative n=1 Tax=Aspergillus clavatus (strain ATCC 1007 / CBS 513.65 / DSM 816 / NCTC 3887 / NRRL 1 / QM 1276 / 107) TaxID=344612 RepID=A1C8I6_ASPCL|nr:NAD binding NADP oxidoreductase coenzyme F420-dependent, putative [Aspergillus clavatus NRRL 1]EAW13623.1 NAD binding NADP oxidoreductase coenzyme F420-dependent, putative [Aspergillus clavatus NRRL 1]